MHAAPDGSSAQSADDSERFRIKIKQPAPLGVDSERCGLLCRVLLLRSEFT